MLSLVGDVTIGHAGGAIVVACFAFVVDLLEQSLVVRELLLVHAAHSLLRGLFLHLLLQELHVLFINVADLVGQSALLKFVVGLILAPNLSLLIVQSLFIGLADPLLLHLLGQENSHLLLFLAVTISSAFVLKAGTEFTLCLISANHLVFRVDALLLFSNNASCQTVHKVLSAKLSLFEFTNAVSFLLVKHFSILLLSKHVSLHLLLTVILSLLLISFVLKKHALKILFFLTTFLILKSAFILHLLLEARDQLNFSSKLLFLFVTLALLLFLHLAVTAFLLSVDLSTLLVSLFLLALAEKLDVLYHEVLI